MPLIDPGASWTVAPVCSTSSSHENRHASFFCGSPYFYLLVRPNRGWSAGRPDLATPQQTHPRNVQGCDGFPMFLPDGQEVGLGLEPQCLKVQHEITVFIANWAP